MNDDTARSVVETDVPLSRSTLDSDTEREAARLLSRCRPDAVPYERRIFVNRNLRLSGIDLVGFDMDYTLAMYHVSVENLAVALTIDRLIRTRGYPEVLRNAPYDPDFAVLGLSVDKKHGNLLKMDNHRHVSRAYHGFEPVLKAERRTLYNRERLRMSSDRFALIDTMFAVPEAWLFARMVDLHEVALGMTLGPNDYERFFNDIRECIDQVHADDSLKSVIRKDVGQYIERDPELGRTLRRIRASGKRTLLLTNSHWDYTDPVMRYLLEGPGSSPSSWRDAFDIVIVAAGKPAFFTEDRPFRELRLPEGQPEQHEVTALERGRVYQGGNVRDFDRLMGTSGDRVLYVGDNMYGDILRSKKATTWRTAMAIPGLERMLLVHERVRPEIVRRDAVEAERTRLDEELRVLELQLEALELLKEEPPTGRGAEVDGRVLRRAQQLARRDCRRIERSLKRCVREARAIDMTIENAFNPHWGQTFTAFAEHSLFGGQLEDYACLYLAKVSNFLAYSPNQYFRTPRDVLPHDHA